ncbi:MAG: hypothetical protein CMH60_04230 [Myxococcales bacterium]|nr:hypothetical protein [Myxococcales bacterium]
MECWQQKQYQEALEPIAHTHFALERVENFADKISAARFALPNGLRVILMANHSAPIFSYQTWFKVGSKHEKPGKTGLAHLFEHLMFKGTTNHPVGEFDTEMESRGCQTNAATWVDWTYYTQSLAQQKDNLEQVIHFESDRMSNLILDEKTFLSELEVVKNERLMSVDNSIGGAMSEQLYQQAFPNHHYQWPTIGYMRDLENTDLQTIRAFYQSYYAPNNAIIVVVGDIDVGATLELIWKAYGEIPAQNIDTYRPKNEEPQEEPRKSVLAKPISTTQVLVAYPAPAQNSPDYAALELLNNTLCDGESSYLYRRMVIEERLASDVSGFLTPFAEPGLFEFSLTPMPGVHHDKIIEQLSLELKSACQLLSTEDVDKARNSLELAILQSFQDNESCAEMLGHFEANFGDFSMAFKHIELWNDLDAETIKTVGLKTFAANKKNIVIAKPLEE